MKNEGVTKINYPKPGYFRHEKRPKMSHFQENHSPKLLINNKITRFRKTVF
jgi:hypothetical protein